MGNVTRYAALYTKVRALEARLLNDGQYLQLLRAQDTQEALAVLLRQTAYGALLRPDMGAAMVERALRQHLFDGYEQMLHYVIDADRKLFVALITRFECEYLKIVIRGISKHLALHELAARIPDSKHFKIRNFPLLCQCHTLEELVAELGSTPYGPLLRPYLAEPVAHLLFYMEMVLDRYYFQQLAKQMQRLSGEDRRFMLELLGINVDLLNVQWLYRGKRYFQLSPELLFNYCLKHGLRLGLKRLRVLCYLEGTQELVAAMAQTPYGFLFDNPEQLAVAMERDIARMVYGRFEALGQKEQLSLVTPVGYLHRLEYELRDVFSILEAKRYGMSGRETAGFLVRVLEGGEQW